MSAENIPYFVIRTIPRFQIEFQVRHALNQREYPTLVPFEEKWVTKRSGEWTERKFPLFPCYVFIGLRDKYEFPTLRDAINQAEEDKGRPPPIIGLIGPGNGQPARLKPEEVERYKEASMESPTEVNIHKALQVGSEIDVFRGAWSGRKTHVEEFTRKGVKAMVELFNSWHVVEISMRDVRAA